ncbi:hypothetical protein [Streptomyces sp. 2A115]|uniref:hypothetical protein n=1 Tax=Streptomyces sp. 2A115 TaxID=3457439 RepID=UPI003FD36F07
MKAPYWETVQQIKECGERGGEKDEHGGKCPVRRAYYRDLTRDGEDDMVLGMRMPENQLCVRAHTFIDHRLVEVMATTDSTLSVEIAGRDVIIRSPSKPAGHEYRTVWSRTPLGRGPERPLVSDGSVRRALPEAHS